MDPPPTRDAVIDVLTRIDAELGPGFALYTAIADGTETQVALTHRRNLSRVGGMFPDENQLFRDVRAAMQDLVVPLDLARALIATEQAATGNGVNAS